jgi:hypothetical protein
MILYYSVTDTRKGIEEKSGFLRRIETRKYRRGAKMMYQIVQVSLYRNDT